MFFILDEEETIKESRAMIAAEEAYSQARAFGFSDFECWLTTGGDDRSLILESGANKVSITYLKERLRNLTSPLITIVFDSNLSRFLIT